MMTIGVPKEEKSGEKEKEKEKHADELSWKEAKKVLKKDDRWSYCKVLDKERKQELFDEHMNKFKAKKRDIFYQLLDETQGIVLKTSTWKEVCFHFFHIVF